MYVVCLLFYAIGGVCICFAYYMVIYHRNDRPFEEY